MPNLIGYGVQQVPTNGMLGNLAFQDKAYVSVDKIGIGTTAVDTGTANQTLQNYGGAYISGSVGIAATNPSQPLDVNGNVRLRSGLYDGNNIVGTSGSILSSTGAGVSWKSGSWSLIDTQTFSNVGVGTWTKPANASLIRVIMVGGGGGGASGAAAVGSGVAGGTGGGAGGSVVIMNLPAADLSNTVAINVGVGGTGGTAVSRIGAGGNATTAGNNGGAGGNSTFGIYVAAGGGGGTYTAANNALGLGGIPDYPSLTSDATANGITITGTSFPFQEISGAGGSGSATDKAPVAVAAVNTAGPVPGGGGFGGTPGNTAVSEDGGKGADAGTSVGISTGGAGGVAGGSINGVVGNNQPTSTSPYAGGGGGGAGGYAASGTATAGIGATGGFPGGGGGGGGSARNNTNTNPNAANGGKGGDGGRGVVIVLSYG